MGSIGDHLRLAANVGQQIVSVQFVQTDSKSRDEPRIRLKFGAITANEKPIDENFSRESIQTDAHGTFTVRLSTKLVTRLLGGKITASDVWKSDRQQEIGDYLKGAVERGQEIVDAKIVQGNLEHESPLIILEFGPATETLIRESKKRLKEGKK